MSKADRFVPIGRPPEQEFRDYLPAIEADNEVVWVNKEVRMPFDIKLGERCDLGLFLTPGPRSSENNYPMEMMYGHQRSGLLGRVVFEDKQRRRYRDVNLKGGGGSSGDVARFQFKAPEGRFGEMPFGLCDRGYAETDREKTEYFLKRGLRTHRVLAIIKLKEIVDKVGNKIPIEEARRRMILHEDEEPVIQVRAFGTQARITNAQNDHHLEDAMQMVGQELKIPNITPARYIEWFAKTLGEQVAILHSSLHTHGYLTHHNITLDCRITDLDSVGRVKLNEIGNTANFEDDLNQVFKNLGYLYYDAMRASNRGRFSRFPSDEKINRQFITSYIQHLTPPGNRILAYDEMRELIAKYGGWKSVRLAMRQGKKNN